MPVTSILFDLDGTLVDSAAGIEYSCSVALCTVLPGRELPDLRGRIGPPLRQILQEALAGVDAEVLDRLVSHFRASYDGEGWQRAVAYPGVAATLGRLSALGVRCFVITNKPAEPTERILQHLGLRHYFAEVACPNSRVPPFGSKAEAAAYLLHGHDLDTQRTIVVGDSEDDAQVAAACGLRFVGVAYGYGRLAGCGWVEGAPILRELGQLLQFVATPDSTARGTASPGERTARSACGGWPRGESHDQP